MTFNIQYCELVDLNKLKEALIYLFPNQSEKIGCITYTINYCDNIIIKNDVIDVVAHNLCDKFMYDNTFVTLVNILKECDDKTFLIQVNDKYEYELLHKLDNNFNISYYHCKAYYYLITKNHKYYITENQKNIFFNHFKIFNVKSYCRKIKMKQLYENIY